MAPHAHISTLSSLGQRNCAPTSEVGYTSAITRKEGPQSPYGHMVAWGGKLDNPTPWSLTETFKHATLMNWLTQTLHCRKTANSVQPKYTLRVLVTINYIKTTAQVVYVYICSTVKTWIKINSIYSYYAVRYSVQANLTDVYQFQADKQIMHCLQ
jgi:hypothetical protein